MKNTINYFLSICFVMLAVAGCKKSGVPKPLIPPPAPTITGISPASGLAGLQVTISGTNFDATPANNTVKFNGTAATVTSATATTLVVNAPAAGTSGAVTVATTAGTATGPVFTYLQLPIIASISPTSAAAGATVTITGTNFDATVANNTVKFNGTTAAITTATTTQLVVTAPAAGTNGNVTVTTPVGISNGVAFTYTVVPTGPDIYVLGSDTRPGEGYGYWKNSVFNSLANCTSAYAMVGTGNNIYIAGPAKSNTPTYWKNGTEVQLSTQTGNTFSTIVSGTDVYFLGQFNGVYYTWKNGTPTALTKTSTSTNIIGGYNSSYCQSNTLAVNNGDVYVAGAESLNGSTILKATYWKNGTPIDLTTGLSGSAWADAVYVSGGDVYVAGIQVTSSGNQPCIWKNGTPTLLAMPAGGLAYFVNCILVDGTDVYAGGQVNSVGVVWKNGVMINTASYALAEQVSSIFLYNNKDLYVTGASSSSGNNCYWVNGNFVEMDPGCNKKSSSCTLTDANQAIAIYVK